MNYEIETKVRVDRNRVLDLIVTSFEGGMTREWARIERVNIPDNPDMEWVRDKEFWIENGRPKFPISMAALVGGDVEIVDFYNEKNPLYVLDDEAIKRGLTIMANKYPKHFADFMNENDDAITGDVFMQCCTIGEVIYG